MTSNHNPHPTHSSNGTLLPALLCLHGGGSNATVFKIQTRRLLWNLSKQFRFVFAEAPLECGPGFGMLPVFESCAPFRRWVSRKFVVGSADVEETGQAEVDAIDKVLFDVMEANGGVESFAGVMGFSQGARLVAGLLLRQKIAERDNAAAAAAAAAHHRLALSGETTTTTNTTTITGSSSSSRPPWRLKFGVMVGGPFPPIALSESVDVKDYELLRTVPTVHAWGRDDHIIEGCEVLHRLCDSDHCFQMDFEGGHHMPLKDVEAKDLCDLIMAAWYASGGTYGVSADESY